MNAASYGSTLKTVSYSADLLASNPVEQTPLSPILENPLEDFLNQPLKGTRRR